MRAETGAGPAYPPVRRDGAAGFTILEVLVALTVLGLVVAVLFEGIASGLRRTSYDEGRLALILEAELILQRIDLDLAGDQPSQSGADGDLRWRLERIPVQAAPKPLSLGAGDEAAVEEGELLLVRYVVTVEDSDGRELAVETKRLRTARAASTSGRPRFGGADPGSSESGAPAFATPEPGGGFGEGESDATP